MKNTTYLLIFLACNLVQIAYFANYGPTNNQIKGESTVSVYIGQLPTEIPTEIPTVTMTPTQGPSATPTTTPTPTSISYITVTPTKILKPTSVVYQIPSRYPIPTSNPNIHVVTPTPAINNFKTTIFGITSPNSQVQLYSPFLYVETNSDEKGNFSFIDQYLPVNSQEVCLETKDNFGRSTSPICLPSIPSKYQANIGPVLIPPTLSLNKDTVYVGDVAKISGQSIPNSQIEISIYTDEKTDTLAFFQKAYAKANPRTTVNTDSKGNFSSTIPTLDKMKVKTFARVYYESKPSDKSASINFNIYVNWMYIFVYLQRLIDILKTNLLALTFLIEVIIALIFIVRYLFHPDRIKKVKHVASKQL